MIAGHYAPSFALRHASKVPLWALFLASQFVDILFAVFIIVGWETVEFDPNYPTSNPLMLIVEFQPFSHSLAATFVWAGFAGGIGGLFWGRRGGLGIAACVLAHWFLDLLVHLPDLPVVTNQHRVGFALWERTPVFAFLLEAAILLGAVAIYVRKACTPAAFWIFGVLMLVAQALSALFLEHPVTVVKLGLTQLALYFGLAFAAWWVERQWG